MQIYEVIRTILLECWMCSRIEMFVDDVAVGQTRLASGDARIAALRDGASGGLFLGGVRTGEDVRQMAASLEPLRGCIYDVVIDKRCVFVTDLINIIIFISRLCVY